MALLVSGAGASGFTQNGDQIEEAAKSVLKLFVYEKKTLQTTSMQRQPAVLLPSAGQC